MNHVLTERAVNAHDCPVESNEPLPVYQYQNAGYVLLSARLFNIIKEIKISMAGESRKTENPEDAGEGLSCIFSDGWEQ